MPEPRAIIFDTDMDTDVDDMGAAAVLHALADNGECEIRATVVSSLYPASPLCLHAVNTYYGRPEIPIGTLRGPGAPIDRGSKYATEIAQEFPHGFDAYEDVPDALHVYRRVLAEAAPGEITIATIGYMTNIMNLLKSGPDEISPLSGLELVKEKVREWVCMGGRFPRQTDPGKWGNFKPDPEATVYAVNHWPESVPLTFFGGHLAKSIQAGTRLMAECGNDNPVRRAYDLFLDGTGRDHHHCADLGTVLYAVRGLGDYFIRISGGHNHIFPDGTHEWRAQPHKTNQSYLRAKVGETIEALLAQPPKLG